MSFPFKIVLPAVMAIALAGPLHAKQLSAPDALQLLSGKSLSCDADGNPVKLKFGKANAKKGRIAFKGKFRGRSISSGYKTNKQGMLVNASTGKARSVSVDAKGRITIKGKGVPDTVCK